MRVIKNINNNVSLCLDSQGREVIVFGKGIGFKKAPCDISLELINRTFYDMDYNFISIIDQLSEDILQVSFEIIDFANIKTGNSFRENVAFTLTDHIQFAIKRMNKQMSLKLPVLYDIKVTYPIEMKIGEYALELIKNKLKIELPQEEAASIALHLIGYSTTSKVDVNTNNFHLIKQSVDIIEKSLAIRIDKASFNYTRFVTHMLYMLDRMHQDKTIGSKNEKLYNSIKDECIDEYQCALKINEQVFADKLVIEELMYLVLHINRLYSRID